MLFTLENGIPLFVPAIFPTKETLDSWPSFRILYVLELVSIAVMVPGSLLLIISMKNTLRLFHRNLIQIIQVHLTAVTVSQIFRISIMVYDVGLVRRTGTGIYFIKTLLSSAWISVVIHCGTFIRLVASQAFVILVAGSFDYLLFALFAVRFVSLSFILTTIAAAIVERVFASYYIHDYENVRRAWISYLVNLSSLFLGSVYYLCLQALAIGLYMIAVLLLVTLLIFVLPSFAMMVVYRRDTAKLRDLENECGHSILNYTLSMKFQLEENVRVSKFVFNASLAYAAWGTVGTLMAVVAWAIFKEEDPISQLFAALINIYLASTFAILVWLSLAAVGKPRTLAMIFSKCRSTINNNESVRSVKTQDTKIVMEQHFKQLESIWAQPRKP